MPIATSTDHGHNLQTVQLLIKKNQVSDGILVSDQSGIRKGKTSWRISALPLQKVAAAYFHPWVESHAVWQA